MSRCWRSWLLAGPRVQVKLLSDYQRWFRLWHCLTLHHLGIMLNISSRQGRGFLCPCLRCKIVISALCPRYVPVQAARWELSLCRARLSAEHGSLRFAENNVFYSLVFSFRQVWLHFLGEARRLSFWECVSPLSHFCWGPWVSLVVSKGGLVGLWAGDVLLFAPSAPPLKIW